MADTRMALEKLLDALGESVQFAASGSLTPVLPGLEVEAVSPIGFPITATDARRLIGAATQAPYGRGEETIVDTDVRRVWQIDPSHFALRNDDWETHVAEIVDAIKKEFGVHQKVAAQLYKLLIYEKGSFFAPHRDTEKTEGMFATLVVCLPSRHEGGTLIVRHDGQTKKIEFDGKDAEFKTQYAAFYADCEHEISPVTSGYRICLVYNLAIAGKKRQPAAPKNAAAVEKAAELLEELFRSPSSELNKIAIPLMHKYSEAGLDPSELKGADRARADVLALAAESLDYQCYLALLTHHQSGVPDYDTWEPRDFRRSYYESYDEDEDTDDGEDIGTDMAEVFDEELSLDHWLDPKGRKQPFGQISLEENEILTESGKEDWLVRQHVSEATGNEGASMERWYRCGVVVIWPRDRYFRILANEGPASAIPALEEMAARSKKPDELEACRTLAGEILGHWQSRGHGDSCTGRMLKLLDKFGTAELVERFIRDVLARDFEGSEGKLLQRLCERFGWQHFGKPLQGFISKQNPEDYFSQLAGVISICEDLCCGPSEMTEERRVVCVALADSLVQLIARWDSPRRDDWHRRNEKRTGVVAGMVHILAAISATPKSLKEFLEYVLADSKHYGLHEVLIPDVKAIHEWLPQLPAAAPAASRLLEHCISALSTATSEPVEPPKDWARNAQLGCKCEDCRALSAFLRDPKQEIGRFALRKDRRQHLHRQIDSHQCDCTHVTEHIGSPQTLVCTKTQTSYERRLRQFDTDLALLADLKALADAKPAIALTRSPRRRATRR